MKIKQKYLWLFPVVLILIGILLGLYSESYHKNIKKHPKMFCYDDFRGHNYITSTIYIETINLRRKYISYYEQLMKGNEPYLDNDIPLNGLPIYVPVYVLGFSEDSLLAEVVSYYDRGRFGGNYTRCWVFSKTLHKTPPEQTK